MYQLKEFLVNILVFHYSQNAFAVGWNSFAGRIWPADRGLQTPGSNYAAVKVETTQISTKHWLLLNSASIRFVGSFLTWQRRHRRRTPPASGFSEAWWAFAGSPRSRRGSAQCGLAPPLAGTCKWRKRAFRCEHGCVTSEQQFRVLRQREKIASGGVGTASGVTGGLSQGKNSPEGAH